MKSEKIYIPICFYYFLKAINHDDKVDADLHSNMFLLFHDNLQGKITILKRFTFQYVSIISSTLMACIPVSKIFTFQYVSIISSRSLSD